MAHLALPSQFVHSIDGDALIVAGGRKQGVCGRIVITVQGISHVVVVVRGLCGCIVTCARHERGMRED